MLNPFEELEYKLKFGIKKHKLIDKDISFGLNLCKQGYANAITTFYEYYLLLSLFKWQISIGWFLVEKVKE